jgi:ferredoxin-type protein NapF
MNRRSFLTLAAATVGSGVAASTGLTGEKKLKRTPLTPPGSVERARFVEHCTACQLCVTRCPSHVLKPSFLEYGLEGMMQPTVFFERGFCNFDCTVCGDVCPTGAILPLTQEQKHLTQIGKVVFNEEVCIVHTDHTNCGACSEHCPTQALSMIPYREGDELTIPHIDTDICVGCGGCEYVCPVRPQRAVYVEGNVTQLQAKPILEEKQKEIEVDDFGF